MKRILFILVVMVAVFYGCTEPMPVEKGDDITLAIKEIDSCEYLEYDAGVGHTRVYSLTHKGNCKYCLARANRTK
ncbi:MAG: hypothetical protein WBP33_00850 [Saprospiraceae bacterium]